MRTFDSPGRLSNRVAAWSGLLLLGAIAALTITGAIRENAGVRRDRAASASALLDHLVSMSELRESEASATYQVRMLAEALRPSGVVLSLDPTGSTSATTLDVVAQRHVDVEGKALQLRYGLERTMVRELMVRSALVHLAAGGILLVVALAVLRTLMRARFGFPLRRLAHQIRFMGAGGGWEPVLPAADAEIAEVNDALRALGPALAGQVSARIEAERRAVAASVSSELRARLRDPTHLALTLLSDVQARDLLTPGGKQKIRAAMLQVERLSREIDATLDARLRGPSVPPPDKGDFV